MLNKIKKAIAKGNYKEIELKHSKRNSAEIYAPKKWEGKNVIIILLDEIKEENEEFDLVGSDGSFDNMEID